MHETVRKALIEVARQRTKQTITYQELSDKCKLGLNMRDNPSDRTKIGIILGEISKFEHNNKRPFLSSIVIRLIDGEEGEGFYKLAEKLGYGPIKKLKEDCFEEIQIGKCIEFWSNEENYKKFS